MLDYIVNNPNLDKYLIRFETGQVVFLEGDDSQDLFILVSGKVDILKGNKKIAEIRDEGAVFGEMSFLLGGIRTASVKAMSDVKAIRIPKDEIATFLNEFPGVVKEFARFLAKRLDETSQIVYGLKEVCDQLPDAVILTDKDGKIILWNATAEEVYGREENRMRYQAVETIYEDPAEYKTFLEKVISRNAVREKTLKVKHPQGGIRHISTSTTVLYDGQHNFQGVLSLGRDATSVAVLERRYRRARRWLVPSLILLLLFVAGAFFGYPYFSKGYQVMNMQKLELRDSLAVDLRLLRSLLVDPLEARDGEKTNEVLRGFFEGQEGGVTSYTGLVLLDKDKKVFDAYSIVPGFDSREMQGSSYGGINFEGSEGASYKVLTLYRAHKDHPMGYRGTEIAFKMLKDDQLLGWLVFQMDMDLLKRKYRLDEEGLKEFQFEKP